MLLWALLILAQACLSNCVPCDFPAAPANDTAPPVCPPSKLTKNDAVARGWQFAPEVRFHPAEDSFLQDPSDFFYNATLVGPRFLVNDTSNCDRSDEACNVYNAPWQNLYGLWYAHS